MVIHVNGLTQKNIISLMSLEVFIVGFLNIWCYFDIIFMVARWNKADHYIFILRFLLSSFFPRLISAAGHWMSTIIPHMVWP